MYKFKDPFCLDDTLDCGQVFRWNKSGNIWKGIAYGKYLEIEQKDDSLCFYNTSERDFKGIWYNYFDLGRDYRRILSIIERNPTLKKITAVCSGIRVINQQPWETLCSFIISQNNNIPRIKGIIDRLCVGFGKKIDGGYTFPEAEVIAELCEEDLGPLRAGFRHRYILDAAKKAENLDDLRTLTIDEARKELVSILGVGKKVADCVLLFGLGFTEAFPEDVWIKRAMESLFPEGLPDEVKPFAGIVQQYIYHYARTCKEFSSIQTP